jgi:hypothetical protein
VNTS